MKKLSLIFFAFTLTIGLPGCYRKRIVKPVVTPEAPTPVIAQPKPMPVAIAYNANIFIKETPAGKAVRPSKEVGEYIKKLKQEDVLTCAYDLLFVREYTIEEKTALLEICKKQLKGHQLAVVSFFDTVLTQHADYLKDNPLTDLNTSLVSYAPEHAEFLKEDEEMTEMLWPIDEIYASGNNLLQEAILLKNEAAIDYLLAKGADPRHLCDTRGTMLSLEWVDKHEIEPIARKLAQTLNKLDPDSKTTILDELIYTDSHAAILVRKYGGKLSSELT